MIIEVPSADDFKHAGLNLLSLAWHTALESLRSYEHSDIIHPLFDSPAVVVTAPDGRVHTIGGPDTRYTPEQRAEAEETFWRRSQPVLGNALSLIQQAVEMGLKGRIAAVSPFLLIARDGRDYPRNSAARDVPFSEFRSIDASDLVRVHNSVCSIHLNDDFSKFWEELRRNRNVIMHTVSNNLKMVGVDQLLEAILEANAYLNPGESWFMRYRQYFENDETQAAFNIEPGESYARLIEQFNDAIRYLPDKTVRKFFGINSRGRAYYCPHCLRDGDNDYMSEWDLGKTAYLHPKKRDATKLRCAVCERVSAVIRTACLNEDCDASVVSVDNDMGIICLFCQADQTEWAAEAE